MIIMKRFVSIALCLMVIISLAACGGGDVLKGTWTCQDNDYCEGEGTYSVEDDNTVKIKLELWDNEKVYDYTVSDNTLKLTATDALSPDYDLTRK
jgi:hypothetical protein